MREIKITYGATWKLFTARIPDGAEVIGIVSVGPETGALARFKRTGVYVMVNAGAIRSLPQKKIHDLLDGRGAPKGNQYAKKDEPLSKAINLRLTEAEYEKIREQADKEGEPVSKYIRQLLNKI